MEIIEYNENFKTQLLDFVLDIQNNEYQLELTLEEQMDLLDIENEYKKNGNFWIAIDDNSNIRGCVATKLLENNKAALKKMFVKRENRGIGLGSSLIKKCLEFLKSNNVDELFLGTVDIFKNAQNFYENSGFIEVERNELPKDFPVLEVDNIFYKYNLFNAELFNPYVPKLVEKIYLGNRKEREQFLLECENNIFKLHMDKITFDLFTDSGTSSFDVKQYTTAISGHGGPMGRGKNYDELSSVLQEIFGMEYLLLCSQGRSAEALLNNTINTENKSVVLCNNLFSTTEYHQRLKNLSQINISDAVSEELQTRVIFKGNIDIFLLKKYLSKYERKIAYVCIELCSNLIGGYPISLKNLKEVYEICFKERVPVVLDATRIIENAYFIKMHEKEQSISAIVKEICGYSDYVTASLKKDFLCDSGGFIGCNDEKVYLKIADLSIIYGQELSNFDKGIIVEGIKEAISNEDNINYRMLLTKKLHSYLKSGRVNVLEPVSGHGVWIDVTNIVNKYNLTLDSIQILIYLETGIREGIEIFKKNYLLRLAIPYRKYDTSHIRYIAELIINFFNNKKYLLKKYEKHSSGDSITEHLYASYLEKL